MKQRELTPAERKAESHRYELVRDLCAISDRLQKVSNWLRQDEDLKQLLRCGDMREVEKWRRSSAPTWCGSWPCETSTGLAL
jgi:hypothetical protein